MGDLSYSFCISLLHSLWQSALLLLFYHAVQGIFRKQPPALKRNLLFGLLFIQVLLTLVTFTLYYSGSLDQYSQFFTGNFSILLQQQPLLETLAPWLISCYLIVLLYKTVIMSWGWRRFKKSCRASALKAPLELRLFLARHAHAFGINRKVSLWISDKISTPLTFGFWKPVILLPLSLITQLDTKSTESLIIHELTHIRNNDYLLNWLLIAMETVFFFNPFIALISSRIKLEREKNCDVQVLQFRYAAVHYAQTLLITAKHKSRFHHFSLAAVFRNKQLLERIKFFTVENNLVFLKARSQRMVMPLITIAIIANLFILANFRTMKIAGTVELASAPFVTNLPGIEKYSPALTTFNEQPIEQPLVEKNNLSKAPAAPENPVTKRKAVSKAQTEQLADVDVSGFTEMAARYAADARALAQQKQVIIEEQVSGTAEAVRKAYALQLENGEWKRQLLYTIKVGKLTLDSLTKLQDSLIYELPVPMQ